MRSPDLLHALRGGLIAFAAAFLFGVGTPLIQRFGVNVGSFSTTALLYVGAAIIGVLVRQPIEREARVRRSDATRIALMALFGAGIGPVALAWGLQHTSGTGASLMLALEAVFTAVLARLWCHETLDRRVTLAMALLTLGGICRNIALTGSVTSQSRSSLPRLHRGQVTPLRTQMLGTVHD